MEILCFFAGITTAYFKNVYPLSLLFILLYFRPNFRYVLWFSAAFFIAEVHQWQHREQHMPTTPMVQSARVEGEVASIPVHKNGNIQFELSVTRFNHQKAKANILLTCHKHCPEIHAGEYWRFHVKLKRPRNLENPGGFDYVRFLKARHIGWTGVLLKDHQRLNQPKPYFSLLHLRERLAEVLYKADPNEQSAGITQALALGVTQHIQNNEWDLFRRTGTIHLMVISGAHIGLMAGIGYAVTKWIWCRFSILCLLIPAQKVASLAALMTAFVYSLLAGFGVPAQRALIVCFFMLLRNFCRQKFSVWQAWRYSLLAVLLFEPHSVLMPGFYLSFLAVAILLLSNQRFQEKGIKKIIILQVACMIGLMPFTMYLFSYGSINGLIANLLAVPWVGFVIIPLALGSMGLGQWVSMPWITSLLKWAISCLIFYLNWVDAFSLLNFKVGFAYLLYPFAFIIGIAIWVFLPVKKFLPIAFLLSLSALFPAYESIRKNEVKIDVMDVGQGLSVLIRTANHNVLYDTGVKFFQGSDMAKLAIIPYLETLGVNRLDAVIISHSDLDHRGGLTSLQEKYPIKRFIVDEPTYYHRGSSCEHYPSWTWDGIVFRFFPLSKDLKGKNNHSCVLQVKAPGGSVLLTGDIEKPAEEYLVKRFGAELHSSVLLIPHHSSKTSSSEVFLRQVSPKYAVSSYGFDNRYHFPHQQTVEIYKKLKISVFNTVDCGKIGIHLTRRSTIQPMCYHSYS
ncbi:DNA internalization-related competence protein ComEC/Rec2 [Legionella impletisoli]|uniref:DNA internalization-related competence protein ComEC/Rec2 n=1 Tax=Legionella impletisoli TaxID=343510 RepID=A0A917JRT2_9GAMM|nr:DNA internalization-related competence protein ComEC/Rec2 [Legionella impletisoli]GGI78562.1 DNA internalization-related competence protein ComEC/Rec2 [Legionella impletisoli]